MQPPWNQRLRTLPTLLLVVTLGTSCGGRSASAGEDPPDVRFERGGFVVTGAALSDGSGSLLSAMSGKVPSFRVQRRARECPQITLRGARDYSGGGNPSIYVDGAHATDTCVLDALRAGDVERVEVYPQGYTTRPGYGRHSGGLILVFMRGA